jgi:hypothetical protein
MPDKSTKFDRCVEGVKQNSPDIDTPEAVCVSRGVEPSSWKKSIPTEMKAQIIIYRQMAL